MAATGAPSTDPPATVWSSAELARDPHAAEGKPSKVRAMFAAIAPTYDLNNRVHSLWQDQAWRRRAVRAAGVKPGETVVDVACGTGDLSEAFARGGAAKVIGVDFTAEMLEIAKKKAARQSGSAWAGKIEYLQGDAQALPIADQCADIVSIAFGIRNVQEPARALREFRRILRPRGRLIILEFSEPRLAPVRWFNGIYCRRIMPITATLISGDRSGAYKYLPRSVETFMSPERLTQLMREAGFSDPTVTPLSLGICSLYLARV